MMDTARWEKLEKRLRLLPGVMAWALFLSLVGFSYLVPQWMAYFLLMYALYWVLRTGIYLSALLRCFFYVLRDAEVNWWARCLRLAQNPTQSLQTLEGHQQRWWEKRGIPSSQGDVLSRSRRTLAWLKLFATDREEFRKKRAEREEYLSLKRYLAMGAERPQLEKIQHLVIIPTYKEGMPTLVPTFEHLVQSNFPLERLHILVAGEAADPDFVLRQKDIKARFGQVLPHLYFTTHTLKAGEVVGKSSNQASAIRWFSDQILAKLAIAPTDLLVTSLDADYRVHPEYFANLTYRFVVDPDRDYHLYQPIPMFFNNIWKVNMFSRINATMGTQIQMARQMDHRENRNFSSYAICYQTIRESGYWDVDVIQEDSRLFWKVFFRYGEKVRVEPLFLPVFGDAVHSASYRKAIASLYDQMRRWAWGASDVPYVIARCLRHREIPLLARVRAMVDVITNYFNWATMPIILALGAFFPFYLNPAFAETVIGYNLPLFTSRLLTLTSLAAIVFLTIDSMMAPVKPAKWQGWRRAMVYLQWLSMPLMGILFAALPAIDAQTRLMMNRSLEYKVTEKE